MQIILLYSNSSELDFTSAPWSRIMPSPLWKSLFEIFSVKVTQQIPERPIFSTDPREALQSPHIHIIVRVPIGQGPCSYSHVLPAMFWLYWPSLGFFMCLIYCLEMCWLVYIVCVMYIEKLQEKYACICRAISLQSIVNRFFRNWDTIILLHRALVKSMFDGFKLHERGFSCCIGWLDIFLPNIGSHIFSRDIFNDSCRHLKKSRIVKFVFRQCLWDVGR